GGHDGLSHAPRQRRTGYDRRLGLDRGRVPRQLRRQLGLYFSLRWGSTPPTTGTTCRSCPRRTAPFLRHLAGHVETGPPSTSDPAIGYAGSLRLGELEFLL